MKTLVQTVARPTWLDLNWAATNQSPFFIGAALLLGIALARLPLPAAAATFAGLVFIITLLVRPWVGLGLTLLLGPMGALENILWGSQLLDSGQAMLAITLAAWLAHGMIRRRVGLAKTPLAMPIALFVGVMALSVPGGVSIGLGLKELLKWAEIAALMLMIVSLVNSRHLSARRLRTILLAMLLLAGTSQALVGIWQFALRGEGPDGFLLFGRFYRAYGTFEQPNPFGGFMNLTALLAWGAFAGHLMHAWNRGRSNGAAVGQGNDRPRWLLALTAIRWPWWLAGLCALLSTAALLFSWSRGAWLGFAAGLLAAAMVWPKKKWQGPLLALLGLLILVLVFTAGSSLGLLPESLLARLGDLGQGIPIGDVRGADINDANYAELERLAHWQAALDMARDHLWLGIGFGAYEAAYSKYALINWPYALGHAHNYYLNLLAEGGVLGLAAYLLLWICVISQTLRLLDKTDWPHRGVLLGLLASWAALATHHLVDKLYVNNIYIHLGVMFGLLQLFELRIQSVGKEA